VAETPWDIANVVMGVASFTANAAVGNYVAAAVDAVGVGLDVGAALTPVVPGGASTAINAYRGGAAVGKVVAKSGGKPDFIVSPNGTTMPTNKDFNLVDSNKKGGDWLQIHNLHTDAKVDGSPHTHYPERHDLNTNREIKRTDGADLDRADNMLRNGIMRERKNRSDKGG
jgi:hypothetical protein